MSIKYDKILGELRERDLSSTTYNITNETTDNGIELDQNGSVGTDVSVDGAIHIENTGNTGIGLGVYTNMGSSASASLVEIKTNNADFDQRTLYVVGNQASGEVMRVTASGAMTPSSRSGILLESTGASSGKVVNIRNTNASASVTCLEITSNGTGKMIYIDDNTTGTNPSIDIDRDGNNATKLWGMKITVDNTGGDVGGIDFSGMSAGEALLKVTADATDPTSGGGAGTGRIAIDVAGVIKYIAYYDA